MKSSEPSLIALLLVTGTSALSTDTYVSALPAMRSSLHTTSAITQLTMTACIGGMAIGQLISGPVSDARGRRTMVLLGCAMYVAMSVLCATAQTGWLLVSERFVQGLAGGACVAVGRAVVNDCYRGARAAALFGTLSAVGLIAPVIAPAIGSGLLSVGDWRVVFWFLAAVGVLMLAAAAIGLPETLPPARRHAGGLGAFGQRTRSLLSDRHFVTPVLIQCLTTAGFFVYIGGSSFVLQQGLGVSQRGYATLFAVNALTMVTASVVFRSLVLRRGPVRLRWWAVAIQTTAVTALFVVVLFAPDNRPPLWLVWGALAGMTCGLGLYLPANAAIAQNAGRRFSGTASSLGGGLPFLAGAATTPLTGALGSQTVLTMASCMVVPFLAAAAIWCRHATLDPMDSAGEGHLEPAVARPSLEVVSPAR